MNGRFNAVQSPSDRDALATAQARADAVAQMFGDSASQPLHSENPIAYRKRLAERFKKHSAEFKETRLDSIDGATFDLIEAKIYADASAAALEPSNMPDGVLIPIVRRDSSGRTITEYKGDIKAWMNAFTATGAIVKINRNHKGD